MRSARDCGEKIISHPPNHGLRTVLLGRVRRILWESPDVDESELPDGLGAWWNKMLKTKAVAALKGKGKKLMPGEHNKAW